MAIRQGFGQPFNATENDLEDELLAANHTLLAVDETRAAGLVESEIGKMLIKVIMRWETGFERGRKNVAKVRQAASVPFILTSNLSLGKLADKSGSIADDAHHGRLISIPMPTDARGIFEDLHGEPHAVALTRRLRSLAVTNFGHPSRQFVKALTNENHKDPKKLRAWVEKRRSFYLAAAQKIDSPGRHMNRIHEKMATVYAAARFAIKHGILAWRHKTVRESLIACVYNHVALLASETCDVVAPGRQQQVAGSPINPESLVDQLRRYVRENREEFVTMNAPGAANRIPGRPTDCPVVISQHAKNGREYLFSEEKLVSIAGDKQRAGALKAALNAEGHIATERGADGMRYSVKRNINGIRRQVIAIRAATFDNDQ